uniref:Uncharacterized protein n=1 Tax=Vibrio sp. 23023 TaxID=452803 RepID=A9M4M3_9VIBR|nr:hypothetical protein [Vibrio sp. 23023]ABX77040.1 Conserved hypothetical protein [Vibrio sp. 23023]
MSYATGIPTIDVANFLQNIQGYLQDLKEYSTLATETSNQIKTAQNTFAQYQKLQQEYELLQAQATALHSSMSQHDYNALWHQAFSMAKQRPFSDIDWRAATGGLYDPDAVKETDKQYGTLDNRIQMENLARQAFDGEVPGSYQRSYQNATLPIYQKQQVRSFEKRHNEQRKQLSHLNTDRNGIVGHDNNELQTLHLIASQNQVMLTQLADLNEIERTQLELSNRLSNEQAVNDQKEKQARLKRIQAAKSHPITVNETPLMP